MRFQLIFKMQTAPFHCIKNQHPRNSLGWLGNGFCNGFGVVPVYFFYISAECRYAWRYLLAGDYISGSTEPLQPILIDEKNKIL